MGNVVASRLQAKMDENNWSGRKLSQAANLSYNAVHYILSGKSKNTKFEVIKNIANILKVSPYYLLGHGEDQDPVENYYDNNNTPRYTQRSYGRAAKPKQEDVPYNGDLYRQVITIIEEILSEKNVLTTQRLEYLAKRIYPQVQKTGKEGESVRGYVEGVVDYALDMEK